MNILKVFGILLLVVTTISCNSCAKEKNKVFLGESKDADDDDVKSEINNQQEFSYPYKGNSKYPACENTGVKYADFEIGLSTSDPSKFNPEKEDYYMFAVKDRVFQISNIGIYVSDSWLDDILGEKPIQYTVSMNVLGWSSMPEPWNIKPTWKIAYANPIGRTFYIRVERVGGWAETNATVWDIIRDEDKNLLMAYLSFEWYHFTNPYIYFGIETFEERMARFLPEFTFKGIPAQCSRQWVSEKECCSGECFDGSPGGFRIMLTNGAYADIGDLSDDFIGEMNGYGYRAYVISATYNYYPCKEGKNEFWNGRILLYREDFFVPFDEEKYKEYIYVPPEEN
ncbi:MAG: hypothetical protein Kow0090_05020 [Myxococcota bacterium]